MIFAIGMLLAFVGTIVSWMRVREERVFGISKIGVGVFFFAVAMTGWILMIASAVMLAWRYLP